MKSHVWMMLVAISFVLPVPTASAVEPGWSGEIVARGTRRQQIESTHILYRPYRPFHVYGNTIRRSHYRGWPLPVPRDLVKVVSVIGDR